MEEISWNSYDDFRAAIDKAMAADYRDLASAMRRGSALNRIEARLQRLELLRTASAYWEPEIIAEAFTYLNVFAYV